MNKHPNLIYLHDIGVVNSSGAILSKIRLVGRANKEFVLRESLRNLGIYIYHEFNKA